MNHDRTPHRKGLVVPGCVSSLWLLKVSEWCMKCKIIGILALEGRSVLLYRTWHCVCVCVCVVMATLDISNISQSPSYIQGSYSSPHRSHALGEGSLHRVLLRTYGKTIFVIIWTLSLSLTFRMTYLIHQTTSSFRVHTVVPVSMCETWDVRSLLALSLDEKTLSRYILSRERDETILFSWESSRGWGITLVSSQIRRTTREIFICVVA